MRARAQRGSTLIGVVTPAADAARVPAPDAVPAPALGFGNRLRNRLGNGLPNRSWNRYSLVACIRIPSWERQ